MDPTSNQQNMCFGGQKPWRLRYIQGKGRISNGLGTANRDIAKERVLSLVLYNRPMDSTAALWLEPRSVPYDPHYHAYILIIVIAICLPLLLFFVALRSYVRIWVPKTFSLDDGKVIRIYAKLPAYVF